jgi:uncharacterized membrane protein YuzA (DUF378 family)
MQINTIAWWLVIVGAVNWLLVGLLGLDLVWLIFGFMPILQKLVYVLVGLSGVWLLLQKLGIVK